MKKTIYVVAMEYWGSSSYCLEEVSVFTSKEDAEKFVKENNNADCSCSLFEEEVNVTNDFEIV